MTLWLSHLLQLVEKDLRLEVRSKETIFSTFLFVTLSLFIFNFSVGIDPETVSKVAPGILWVVITFSGTIVLNLLASRDRADKVGEGVLLTGRSGILLFFSKTLTALLSLCIVEVLIVPLFMIFFNFDFFHRLPLVISILGMGTIGFVAVGTLFASLLVHARFRELLLPIVFYPVIAPLLIAAIKATAGVLEESISNYAMLLVGFDIIFVTASALLYEFVIEDPS